MVLTSKNINIIVAISLLLLNFFTIIIPSTSPDVDDMVKYINLAIPIISLVFISLNKKMHIFYMVLGVLITAFDKGSNFSGSLLFFISMYDNKNKNYIITNIIFIVLSFCINAYRSNTSQFYVLALLIAFVFVFGHMYIRFWTVADTNEKACTDKGLTPEQKETIDMLLKGYKHQKSADLLNIARKTYTARVASLRTRFNAKSDFLLAISLLNNGIISLNTFANAKIDNKELPKQEKKELIEHYKRIKRFICCKKLYRKRT